VKYIKYFNNFCQLLSLLTTFFQTFIALLFTWISAYVSPSKSILITIDRLGEAFPELIMWIIITPICIYGLYLNLKYLKDCQIIDL